LAIADVMMKNAHQVYRLNEERHPTMGHQKRSADHQPAVSGSSDDDVLKRKEYEKELRKLQTELCSLQDWVKATGERIIVIFEGRTPPARAERSER
jgi:polyphosphate kinase 2 (PPK2 family)